MKSNISVFAFCLMLFGSLLTSSFKTATVIEKPEEMMVEKFDGGEMYYAPTGSFYEVTFTKDTIANAANDTLYLPSRLRPILSDFQMCLNVTRTNISGTTALAVKAEETTYVYTGASTPPTAGWSATLNSANAAAATAATTATTEAIFIPHAYGINYRFVVDGSGTQSSSYVLRLVLKKKT
jgi:hypothetical protein